MPPQSRAAYEQTDRIVRIKVGGPYLEENLAVVDFARDRVVFEENVWENRARECALRHVQRLHRQLVHKSQNGGQNMRWVRPGTPQHAPPDAPGLRQLQVCVS